MNYSERRRLERDKRTAIGLLNKTADSLPIRSIEHDILVCALLYLEGDTQPGHTVERWWKSQDEREAA